MSDGGYILPRVQNSQSGVQRISIINMEDSDYPEKCSAAQIVARTRKAFNSGKTKSYDFRMHQLKNIRNFLYENGSALSDALYKDLRKPELESRLTEIDSVIAEVNHILNHLKEWMRPEVPEKPLMNAFDNIKIYSDPYGVVLVMGAWNYPLNLVLSPVLGAIAAGNCCIIKPSDLAPNVGQLLFDLLPKYVDQECYPVFLGGIPETTDLLKERFDYIFYTGSTQVGKIVHKAAANWLTPCTLELGGKSPTFLDASADMQMATKRILWGKLINCGQTCVAPDYLLCTKDVQAQFIECANKCIEEFFGGNIKQSKDYARIVNERHFIRVCNLLKDQKIALGGNVDAQDLFVAPTILIDVKPEDDVMTEEIFGPILPIINVNDPEEAVRFINEREKPLALYIFAKDQKVKDLFLNNTSSGGVCINDTVVHLTVGSLPFGGVGNSGMGSYHGKKSFDTFVHKKSVLLRNFGTLNEKLQEMRYPPYSEKHAKMLGMAVTNLNRSIGVCRYFTYALVFGLGVGVTVGGFFIKKHYFEEK